MYTRLLAQHWLYCTNKPGWFARLSTARLSPITGWLARLWCLITHQEEYEWALKRALRFQYNRSAHARRMCVQTNSQLFRSNDCAFSFSLNKNVLILLVVYTYIFMHRLYSVLGCYCYCCCCCRFLWKCTCRGTCKVSTVAQIMNSTVASAAVLFVNSVKSLYWFICTVTYLTLCQNNYDTARSYKIIISLLA